ncbi:hypothetical protein MPH_00913 [Macrophomina phaseolina MS6]|uniref:Uncharacterized protein n=1 Tax=Macrophomina phaseolina (strain MS6) TaxID=1126212 RepID=K2SA28_MACPH|nr:hypothetical protein MPH_00913 [Macrophomina phaseolina MS6]
MNPVRHVSINQQQSQSQKRARSESVSGMNRPSPMQITMQTLQRPKSTPGMGSGKKEDKILAQPLTPRVENKCLTEEGIKKEKVFKGKENEKPRREPANAKENATLGKPSSKQNAPTALPKKQSQVRPGSDQYVPKAILIMLDEEEQAAAILTSFLHGFGAWCLPQGFHQRRCARYSEIAEGEETEEEDVKQANS